MPVKEAAGKLVASVKSKAGVASVPPSPMETPPKEIFVVPESLDTSIEPANCAFVIVPTSLVVLYPVASCKSKAGVASVAPKAIDTPPSEREEFTNFAFAIAPPN